MGYYNRLEYSQAISKSGEPRITTLDTATEINIEGMSQAELDAIFFGKTFYRGRHYSGEP